MIIINGVSQTYCVHLPGEEQAEQLNDNPSTISTFYLTHYHQIVLWVCHWTKMLLRLSLDLFQLEFRQPVTQKVHLTKNRFIGWKNCQFTLCLSHPTPSPPPSIGLLSPMDTRSDPSPDLTSFPWLKRENIPTYSCIWELYCNLLSLHPSMSRLITT